MPYTEEQLRALSPEQQAALLAKLEGEVSRVSDLAHTIPSAAVNTGINVAAAFPQLGYYAGKAGKALENAPPPDSIPGAVAAPTTPSPESGVIPKDNLQQPSVDVDPQSAIRQWAHQTIGAGNIGDPYYQPQHAETKFLNQYIPFLPAAALPPYGAQGALGSMARALLSGASGTAAGIGSSEAAKALGFSNLAPGFEAAGQIAGSFIPGMIPGKVTPHPMANIARKQDVSTLENAGIDVSAGVRTGSPSLLRRETESGMPLEEGVDPKTFTSSILTKAGVDPRRAASGEKPSVMLDELLGAPGDPNAKGLLRNRMDRLAATTRSDFWVQDPRQGAVPEPELYKDIQALLSDYKNAGGKLNGPKMSPIETELDSVFNPSTNPKNVGNFRNGPMPNPKVTPVSGLSGQDYQNTRDHIRAAVSQAWDEKRPNDARALHALGVALDKNMARTPGGEEWPVVQSQYREALLARDATRGDNPPGVITPKSAWAASKDRPDSDLFKVSKAATELGRAQPGESSGWRDFMKEALIPGLAAGTAAAAGGSHVAGGELVPLLAFLSGGGLTGAMNASIRAPYTRSALGQARLGNQLLNPNFPGVGGSIARTLASNAKLDAATAAKLLLTNPGTNNRQQ